MKQRISSLKMQLIYKSPYWSCLGQNRLLQSYARVLFWSLSVAVFSYIPLVIMGFVLILTRGCQILVLVSCLLTSVSFTDSNVPPVPLHTLFASTQLVTFWSFISDIVCSTQSAEGEKKYWYSNSKISTCMIISQRAS